ncbi:hypothetical protein DL771_003212 [Monosporascus sp. 5C6A]|nr:hypothetical protein DL771_003212 [Monosporascus sp. 5C6A]
MYQQALQGYKKALGPEHTSTLNTVHNLGNLYKAQGKLGEAEKMYQQALQGYEKTLGRKLVKTYIPAVNTAYNLGLLFAGQAQRWGNIKHDFGEQNPVAPILMFARVGVSNANFRRGETITLPQAVSWLLEAADGVPIPESNTSLTSTVYLITMAASQPNQCLVSLEVRRRQFLFFCEPETDNIVYYHLPAGDGSAQFRLLGRVNIPTNAGTNTIRSSSNWFGGTVYGDQELRLYINVKTKGQYLVREFCATVLEGTADFQWTEGSFSRDTSRSVRPDSLITAMTDTDGYPTVIYQSGVDGTLVRLHQGAEARADTRAGGWIQKNIALLS